MEDLLLLIAEIQEIYNQLVPLLDCQLADYINFLRDLHSQSPHPV